MHNLTLLLTGGVVFYCALWAKNLAVLLAAERSYVENRANAMAAHLISETEDYLAGLPFLGTDIERDW